MQVSLETTQGLERKLTITVPAGNIEPEIDQRIAQAAKTVRINGFRPGKVPMKVVKQRYGLGLRQEVVGDVVNKTFVEAIQSESLNPAGQPSIELTKNEVGQDLEYIATFELIPTIDDVVTADITLSRLAAEVTEDDVESMIAKLRDQQAKWQPVDRAAADGDKVNIDYVGTKGGEAFDGGTAQGSDLTLGSGQMIPGFESGIEGMSKGECKTVALSFPDDYHAEELKGAEVEFTITLNSVEEKVLPELNADFFALFDVDGDETDFRKKVRSNMEGHLSEAIKGNVKQQVMDAILDKNPLDLPKVMVQAEIDVLRKQSVARFGANPEDFDASMLPDELFEEQARKRVALGLLISTLVAKREIKPEAELVQAKIAEIAESYDSADEVVNFYNNSPEHRQQIEMLVVEQQVVDVVVKEATVEDKSSTYDEVLASSSGQQ